MKSFIGIGNGNTKASVEEAVKNLKAPRLILFLAPYEALEEAAALIHEKFPEAMSMGAVGAKIVNGTVSDKNIAVLGFFDDIKFSSGIITKLSRFPIVCVKELEQNIRAAEPGYDDTVCIEYCTGQEERLVTLFHSCLERENIPLAGGTVFNIPDGKAGIVAYNGKVYQDASVYAIIKNTTGRVHVFKENIYHKCSDISHYATKVDIPHRGVVELDSRPAADVFSEELGVPKNKIVDNVLRNTMGRIVGDEVYISAMSAMRGEGELTNYKRINKNDCIYFLELGNYREIEEETRRRIHEAAEHISLVVSVDCAHRHQLYESEGYMNTYAKDMAALGPHFGIIGGGEQFNNQHVNQSMVCAVFE